MRDRLIGSHYICVCLHGQRGHYNVGVFTISETCSIMTENKNRRLTPPTFWFFGLEVKRSALAAESLACAVNPDVLRHDAVVRLVQRHVRLEYILVR